jgi:DUF4097 and DUF4098 domain-containing protein YvlB
MRRTAAVTLFGFVVICLASLPAMADVWNREWTVTGPARIVVNADESNIRVEAVDSNQVKAFVKTVGWRIADNEVRIIERQSGNLIEIELRRPSKSFELRLRHEITIELTVPRSAEADLHTGHGNITTRGVEAALKCDTGDGNIAVTGAKGTIRFHTGDGNIRAEQLDGTVTADTGDGNVTIAGRLEGLEAQTGDGNVEITADSRSRMGSEWKVQTGDGNIVLNLPDGIGADLDAHTDDGRITCDFSVATTGKAESTRLRGPMNGGGPLLEVRTGDGNIKIARR